MDIIDQIAEARIQEALKKGELNNLPGEGKPLILDDDALIPPDLRAAYRILKNSGFLPPELQIRREISAVEHLLAQLQNTGGRTRLHLHLQVLKTRLESNRGRPINLQLDSYYYQRMLERMQHRLE
jgi:hypothetical protein